ISLSPWQPARRATPSIAPRSTMAGPTRAPLACAPTITLTITAPSFAIRTATRSKPSATRMSEAPFAVIGAGPAGLIAAETLSAAGARVVVLERMPSPARKFLMASRGGLNLTHSEDLARLLARYGAAAGRLAPMLENFTPRDLIAWADGLGAQAFVGSSGRVFPKAMKASPLLRAWLARLAAQGVDLRTRRRWTGWTGTGALAFARDDGAEETMRPRATLLALGGASWPKLGSDGAWAPLLAA